MSRRHRSHGAPSGFTLIEFAIALVILSIVMVFAIRAFQNSRTMTNKATELGDLQQSARIGIDLMAGDMRSAGYGVDIGNGQVTLAHAGPWDVIFNANVLPATDDLVAPGSPGAIDVGLAPAGVPPGAPLYTPAQSFATGAETIRYTLDSSGDGVVSAADLNDDAEEATANPADFILRKEVYGNAGDGTNGGNGEALALVRGPVAGVDGLVPTPLFTYWIDDDNDETTPDVLHGDGDGDGELSQAEILAVGPVALGDLALVTRAVVTLTTETADTGGRPDYVTNSLISSVTFRNSARRTGVVTGTVFQDTDGDGVYDSDESAIAGTTVRLSNGDTVTSNVSGRYSFETEPGSYTVQEFDPPGYTSTTPNTATITVLTGQTALVDFGDRPGSGVGRIEGIVYEDANFDLQYSDGERPIENVIISLHTGEADTTDSSGKYGFDVAVGTYTVVQTDSTGYASTTPNAVEVVLSVDGETANVDFGDVLASGSGTVEGTVYLDANRNQVFDADEDGIADVTVYIWDGVAWGDTTVTTGAGEYSLTVPPGRYYVYELDPDGYSSTTTNLVSDVWVDADSTQTVDFGDILDSSLNFTVVTVGQTDRALSIESMNFNEDNKGDPDIILGTQLSSGGANLHVWHNERRNSGTALTALFDAAPTFSRTAGYPIPSLEIVDADGNSVPDLLAGLDVTVAPNLQFWVTQTNGGNKGKFATTPAAYYTTNSGSSVLTTAAIGWLGSASTALLVGTVDGTGSGHVEVWAGTGTSYAHVSTSDIHYDATGGLGEVTAIAVADFNGDGYSDFAVGQDASGYLGRVTVFYAGDSGGDLSVPWTWHEGQTLWTEGSVKSLVAVDMKEDSAGDVDLVVGTSTADGLGVIELWLNDVELGKSTFGDPGPSSDNIRSDFANAGGEALALSTATLDPDVFPDLVIGLRTSQYAGSINVFRAFGYLPSSGTQWSNSNSGEVVTLVIEDFNLDGLHDIAAGTRTSISSGELVVYFGQ